MHGVQAFPSMLLQNRILFILQKHGFYIKNTKLKCIIDIEDQA